MEQHPEQVLDFLNQAVDSRIDYGLDILRALAILIAGTSNAGVAGTGQIGRAGFRTGSVPIIVYTTDNLMRDADGGFETPPG